MTEEEQRQMNALIRDKCKQVSIQFLEYIMLENSMISEPFSPEEKEQMEEEYYNFITQ